MTLLREIQQDATDGTVSLASLLRRCAILASRLQDDSFKSWVSHELNGYPDGIDLPDYRRSLRGHLVGQYQLGLQLMSNVVIPDTNVPEEYREGILGVDFRQPVAELASYVERAGSENLKSPLSPQAISVVEDVYVGVNTVSMYLAISPSRIAGILDSIRTRALEFAIEIERLNPAAGEAEGPQPPVPASDVQRAVNNYFFGGQVNVAQASHNASQTINVGVNAGDLPSLIAAVTRAGASQQEVIDLQEVIAEEPDSFGPRTQGWFSRVSMRLAQAGVHVGESAGGELIALALASYFHIAPALPT